MEIYKVYASLSSGNVRKSVYKCEARKTKGGYVITNKGSSDTRIKDSDLGKIKTITIDSSSFISRFTWIDKEEDIERVGKEVVQEVISVAKGIEAEVISMMNNISNFIDTAFTIRDDKDKAE